ncbi:retrovirus-related pol polyprotein from transposon RE1 [Tanacetum coccineum]
MVTRSKVGTVKIHHIADLTHVSSSALHLALYASKEPKGFKTAARDPKWFAAMCDEMNALKLNATWDLVHRPTNSNVVGSKWVFRTKFHADGTIDKFKARLVAKGFIQFSGLDYSATFSPIVKASTVRIILSLVMLNKWPLQQLDVKNAFLNGHLSDIVYMEQPRGFVDPWLPNHDSNIFYLLVYVDDIILTTNNATILRAFITRLNKEFLITDLGALKYLTITSPDLSYAVNQVSRFLHAPMQDHFQAVKRILRYVKGTISYGLSFLHTTSPTILGYSDADWARCIET